MMRTDAEKAFCEELERRGWAEWDTGGGCVAMVYCPAGGDGGGPVAVATSGGGCALPMAGDWLLAVYRGEEWTDPAAQWSAATHPQRCGAFTAAERMARQLAGLD